MTKLTMAKSADFKPRQKKLTQIEIAQITENRKVNIGYAHELPRQKLRISDLYPDEQFIKEYSTHEYKYFILMILPVAVASVFVLVQKLDLYNEFLTFLEGIFSKVW